MSKTLTLGASGPLLRTMGVWKILPDMVPSLCRLSLFTVPHHQATIHFSRAVFMDSATHPALYFPVSV